MRKHALLSRTDPTKHHNVADCLNLSIMRRVICRAIDAHSCNCFQVNQHGTVLIFAIESGQDLCNRIRVRRPHSAVSTVRPVTESTAYLLQE